MSDHSAAFEAVDRNLWQRQVDAARLPRDARLLVVGVEHGALDGLLPDHAAVAYLSVEDLGDAALAALETDSLDAVLVRDALWRMGDPAAFFRKVEDALKPGGRLVLLEPGITPMSWLAYSLGPNARMSFDVDPLAADQRPAQNLARPSLLFMRMEHRIAFQERFPRLHRVAQEWLDMLAGPLSDIRGVSVMPEGAVDTVLRLEEMAKPFLGRWLSFRLLTVLEKTVLGLKGA